MFKTVFRGQTAVAQMPLNENIIYSHVLMAEHAIKASFQVPVMLPIQIGDYIRFKDRSFYINTVPSVKRENNHLFTYNVTFEDIIYRLFDKILMHNGLSDFPYFTNAAGALQLIVDNINQIDGGWSVGEVDETDDHHLFIEANTSCRAALTNFAETFELEWYNDGKIIHLVKQAGLETSHVFEYGEGKGLYGIERAYVESKNIATKVYGYGSSKNLPLDYRGGVGRITFEERFLTANTDLYGIKEGAFIDEEIFPRREGIISAVSAFNESSVTFTITDSDLDFDVSDTIVEGQDGKVSFKTGELAGAEFVITGYDHPTKTITLRKNDDDPNNILPSTIYQPHAGDKYVLIDIEMPQSYITAAEQEVKDKTAEYTAKSSVPVVAYSITPDLLLFRDNGIDLKAGDRVRIKDTHLGVDVMIRVSAVSYPITYPGIITQNTRYSITIADFVPYSIQDRIKLDVINNSQEIRVVDRTNSELAKRITNNFRKLQQLIPDPDDYFNEAVKAEIVETLLLSVGTRSQNYGLNNVIFKPNFGGDPNALSISAGQLIHREIEIEGLGYIWNVTAASFNNLTASSPYYIYARCSKTSLTGTWKVSTTPVKTEAEAGFYNFHLGILYPVNSDGYRDHDFTYGVTWIVGENITTGRIRSIDGLSYFDLNAGSWRLGEGANYNVDIEDTLVIKDAVNTGKVLVGSGSTINAGLSGEGASPTSVRGWAGAPYDGRETAPFRFLQNGKVYASDLEILNGSKVGDWLIDNKGLKNTNGNAFIDLKHPNYDISVKLGTALFNPFVDTTLFTQAQSSAIKCNINRGFSTTALSLEASGAQNNFALDILAGDIKLPGGTGKTFTLRTKCGHGTYPKADGSGDFIVSSGDEPYINFRIINGINCGAISIG